MRILLLFLTFFTSTCQAEFFEPMDRYYSHDVSRFLVYPTESGHLLIHRRSCGTLRTKLSRLQEMLKKI